MKMFKPLKTLQNKGGELNLLKKVVHREEPRSVINPQITVSSIPKQSKNFLFLCSNIKYRKTVVGGDNRVDDGIVDMIDEIPDMMCVFRQTISFNFSLLT